VGWSYELLSDDERRVFCRLAVFPASFDPEAAEQVADDADGSVDVVEVVVRLVERSLVQHDSSSGRYRLLETLRQYGADRLAEAGETDGARDAHTAFFCELVERLSPALIDARWNDAAARLIPELDNLRAAAAWLAENGRWVDLQQLGRRAFPLLIEFAPADGARWLRQALDGQTSPEDQERVDAIGELALLILGVEEIDVAAGLADRSIRLADDRGLQPSPWAWATRVLVGVWSDDHRGSLEASRAGLAVAYARQDESAALLLEAMSAVELAALGDLDASQAAADKSVAMAVRAGNPVSIAATLTAAAGARLYNRKPPDFAGALEVLQRNAHHHRLAEESLNGLWLELMRGLALVGAQPGTSVSFLARCLRSADHLQAFTNAELAVRLLVLDAATAGETKTAATLLGYLETNLVAYRSNGSGLVWLDERINEALAAMAAEECAMYQTRGATLTRRELMSLVTTLERTLAEPV